MASDEGASDGSIARFLVSGASTTRCERVPIFPSVSGRKSFDAGRAFCIVMFYEYDMRVMLYLFKTQGRDGVRRRSGVFWYWLMVNCSGGSVSRR